jgi:uncharacterized repeat protein (TIGR03803 family)
MMQLAMTMLYRLIPALATVSCVTLLSGCGGGAQNTYTVSAKVSGLYGSGLILQLGGGSDVAVKADGSYTFATPLASGASYQVGVKTQPSSPQQTCSLANGSGTISAGNVTVTITCVTVTHSVSVTVSGLSGTGLALQLNGGNNLLITANGTVAFAASINSGATYAVTVERQPTLPTQTCSVTNGSGTIGTANVSGVAVACITPTPMPAQASLTTLYSFTGGADGAGPNGSLIQGQDGSLYGTTFGTVFRITTSGEETTLYSFPSPSSANYVGGTSAGLILASDGNFYGTMQGDGLGNNISGSVYRISPTGAESVIYTWSGPDVGDLPLFGGVIQGSNGLLYGTAYGSSVFSLTTTGSGETEVPVILYGCDGVRSSLVQAHDGSLYGTIINSCPTSTGSMMGSVFKAMPGSGTGVVATIDIIGNIPGGSFTYAPFSLIEGKDGNLYGTASSGGAQSFGTVFRITPSGTGTVLYSFGAGPSDGQNPSGALVLASDGNFYGTTRAGGTPNANCKASNGCGTLYRITPSGAETVLYSFGTNGSEGIGPSGALLQANDGNLYGTTTAGGTANAGTVFKLVLGTTP